MNTENMPESLLEAVAFFADEDRAHTFFVRMRWPDGVRCAHCESENVGALVVSRSKSGKVRRVWNCKACKRQFTAKINTVFAESPLPLSKWLPALWLITNAKNGISSCELARALKITQKSAWFMGHRLRAAIQRGGGIVNSNGVFECDESFIGGLSRNMHADKRAQKIKGTGATGKSIVMGLLARHSEKTPTSQVVTRVVSSTKAVDLMPHVRQHIPAGAEVHTDTWVGYKHMGEQYAHKVVDHAEAYVKVASTQTAWKTFGVCSNGPSRARTFTARRSIFSAISTSKLSDSTSAAIKTVMRAGFPMRLKPLRAVGSLGKS